MDSAVNAVSEQQLLVECSGNSYGLEFIQTAPLARDTDGFCTTEYVSGDWPAEVLQENLTVMKQEPDDVCCIIYVV